MSFSTRALAAAGAVALLAVGCGGEGGEEATGPGGSTDPLANEMRSWEGGCEVLDNLQPIWDYMQIESADTGSLSSRRWGQGMDAEALTCNGLVTVKTFRMRDGYDLSRNGELWGGIVPWENEEQARESYVERTVEDIELLQNQSSTRQVTARIPAGPEWDEGELIVMEFETGYELKGVARDGQWLFFFEVNYGYDLGEEYWNDNQHDPEIASRPIEDFAYPFDDEALQQWLVTEYMPSVHGTIAARIEAWQAEAEG